MPASVLLREVRLVPVGTPAHRPAPVDVRIRDGVVTEVSPHLSHAPGENELDAEGRWAIPGLWDCHVHLRQWAETLERLDVSGTRTAADVTGIVARHVTSLPAGHRGELVTGYGYRAATGPTPPPVAELDAASGDHPVVLISGDGHNGWLNSRALDLLGVPERTGALDESEWFPVFARLDGLSRDLAGVATDPDAGYREALRAAAAKGVVGVVDMEFGAGYRDWPERYLRGVDSLRVRTATYPDLLDNVIAAGLRSGDPLPGGDGLLTMGPLKIIADGSLNTRTAYCHHPYADADSLQDPAGKLNLTPDELTVLLRRATGHGLDVAVHAIGDAAVGTALDAFTATGARGSIEHAQLVCAGDIIRMSSLAIVASVQPAHLYDDRAVTQQCWPDRADRCFPLRSLVDAGVRLALGSDAPVARLDPWLAMAAAVHRSADDEDPWNPAESLTPAQALAASTGRRTAVTVGGPADIAILDDDPLADNDDSAAAAEHLKHTTVAATMVAGRLTHLL